MLAAASATGACCMYGPYRPPHRDPLFEELAAHITALCLRDTPHLHHPLAAAVHVGSARHHPRGECVRLRKAGKRSCARKAKGGASLCSPAFAATMARVALLRGIAQTPYAVAPLHDSLAEDAAEGGEGAEEENDSDGTDLSAPLEGDVEAQPRQQEEATLQRQHEAICLAIIRRFGLLGAPSAALLLPPSGESGALMPAEATATALLLFLVGSTNAIEAVRLLVEVCGADLRGRYPTTCGTSEGAEGKGEGADGSPSPDAERAAASSSPPVGDSEGVVTALHIAAREGRAEMCALLLALAADTARNNDEARTCAAEEEEKGEEVDPAHPILPTLADYYPSPTNALCTSDNAAQRLPPPLHVLLSALATPCACDGGGSGGRCCRSLGRADGSGGTRTRLLASPAVVALMNVRTGAGGRTALHFASRSGGMRVAAALMGRGACEQMHARAGNSCTQGAPCEEEVIDVNAVDAAQRSTALHDACSQGRLELARLLLRGGRATNNAAADTNARANVEDREGNVSSCVGTTCMRASSGIADAQGNTALHVACRYLKNGVDDELLRAAVGPYAAYAEVHDGTTTALNDPSPPRLVIRQGLGLNAVNSIGLTPLHTAVGNGNVAAVRALLEYRGGGCGECDGGLLTASNDGGAFVSSLPLSPEAPAVADGPEASPFTAAYCPRCHCDVNAVAGSSRRTPLHVACVDRYPSLAIVALLLRHGASIAALDARGLSPLQCAARYVRLPPPSSQVVVTTRVTSGVAEATVFSMLMDAGGV